MSFIRRIPLPMSALALGAACLGNLLSVYSLGIRTACGVIASAIVLLIALRMVVDLQRVRAELENPAQLAVFPTFFMALMLLAAYLLAYAPTAAKALWLFAIVMQLLVVLLFVARHVLSFKLSTVVPGWFLVFVGFVVASVTSPAFDMGPAGRVLLYAGLIGYAALLPVVVYRMMRGGELPQPVLPTLAIFAAPPSLCLVGYLAVTQAKEPDVVYALLSVSALSMLYVLTRLPGILKLGFLPSFGALTFPFAIWAVALKQANAFLATTEAGAVVPEAVVVAMEVAAAAVVLYVLVRYTAFLVVPVKEPQAAAAPTTI